MECLTIDVQRKLIGIDDSSEEVEVLREEVFEFLADKDSSDIQLDLRLLLVEFLHHVEGCPFGNEQQCTKLDVSALCSEVLPH